MPIAAENPLGLRIPERSPASGERIFRPKEIELWLERLPVASGTQMASKLFRAIQEMNRTHIPPYNRIQIAELFTHPIERAVGTQERKFVNVDFPLSDKAQLAAHVCARLNEELAYSYKIAMHDLITGGIGSQERKLLIISLFRTVRQLSNMVYRSILIYELVPRHLWHELHRLYAFAETNKWTTTRIKITVDGETTFASVRDVYLQILLFITASPYRLRQRDSRALYFALPNWLDNVQLRPVENGKDNEYRYIVQLKSAQAPLHASLVQTPVKPPALEFNTRALVDSLRTLHAQTPEAADALDSNIARNAPSKDAVRRLLQAWGGTPTQRPVRTRLNFDLEIVVGLAQLCRLLKGDTEESGSSPAKFGDQIDTQPPTSRDLDEESTFASELLDSVSDLTLVPLEQEDGLLMHGSSNFRSDTEQGQLPASSIWSNQRELPVEASTTSVHTLNESTGGYCVSWRRHDLPKIKIGELIGIQSPGNPSDYGLATIRWMQNDAQQGLQIGLQLLAPSVLAVSATLAERDRRTPVQCLLVPELKSADRPASLVTPTMQFKVEANVQIRHRDMEQRVRLVRLLESTGVFSQFQIEYG